MPVAHDLPGRRACRPRTGAASTTRTSSAPTGAGDPAQGNYAVVWQALASTIAERARPRTQPDGRPIMPGPGRAGRRRCTSARRAARTGCGASGNTSRGSASSSTTSATWNARTTTRRRWRSPTGRWSRGGTRARRRRRCRSTCAADARRPHAVERGQAGRAVRQPTNFWCVLPRRSTCAARYFDDRETGDGTALERAADRRGDGEHRVRSAAAADRQPDRRRSTRGRAAAIIFGVNGDVALRALSRLELALAPDRRLRERRAPLLRQGHAAPTCRSAAADDVPVRDADRGERGRDAARRLHLHARAVAAVLHAALPRTGPLRPAVHGHAARGRASSIWRICCRSSSTRRCRADARLRDRDA